MSFQINIMELSNAVGRYLSSAARQRELLGGNMTGFSTYLSYAGAVSKESEGVAANFVFYFWGGGCIRTPHE